MGEMGFHRSGIAGTLEAREHERGRKPGGLFSMALSINRLGPLFAGGGFLTLCLAGGPDGRTAAETAEGVCLLPKGSTRAGQKSRSPVTVGGKRSLEVADRIQ